MRIHSLVRHGPFQMRSLRSYKEVPVHSWGEKHRQSSVPRKGPRNQMTYLSGKRPYKDAHHTPHILDACHRSRSIRVFGVQDKMLSYIVVQEFQRGGQMHDGTFGNVFSNDVHTLQSASRYSTLERVRVDRDRFKATRATCESTVRPEKVLYCCSASTSAGWQVSSAMTQAMT